LLNILKSKTAKQTAILLGSQLAMVAIGFGIKTIQTKVLGPENYGLYAFFGSFTGFAVLFFRFGFFSSLQVLLAENKKPIKEQELFGLGFLVNLFVGILFAIFIWATSFYIDEWFHTNMGSLLRMLAPLTLILPTRSLISALTIGSNKVHILPIYDNVGKVFFILTLILFAYTDSLTVFITILFNLLTLLVSFGVIYRQFQPRFENLKSNFELLWAKTKSYGFKFYLGSTANQSTFKLDEVAIVYFISTTANAFYSLANVIASPMIMGSQALSNALFKDFSQQEKIPKKVFIYNTLWLLGSMTILYFISDWIVSLMFGEEYSLVSHYTIGLSIAFFFQGLYQPFNFLSAKSDGNAVRNVAFLEAFINLAGNLILIPQIGVIGAIYTSVLAKMIHFIGKWYYYRLYLKRLNVHG
jgi:O-antigen/teichoic acid export membrane protein